MAKKNMSPKQRKKLEEEYNLQVQKTAEEYEKHQKEIAESPIILSETRNIKCSLELKKTGAFRLSFEDTLSPIDNIIILATVRNQLANFYQVELARSENPELKSANNIVTKTLLKKHKDAAEILNGHIGKMLDSFLKGLESSKPDFSPMQSTNTETENENSDNPNIEPKGIKSTGEDSHRPQDMPTVESEPS